MMRYRLVQYSFGDYETEIISGIDQDAIAKHAIKISALDDPYMYTYRLEKWVDKKNVGEWRFFQNGREFTQDIVNALRGHKS